MFEESSFRKDSNRSETRKKKIIVRTVFLLNIEFQLTFVSPGICKNSHGINIRHTNIHTYLCAVTLCSRHFSVKCCLMSTVFSFYTHTIIKVIQCLKLPHCNPEFPRSNLSSEAVSWLSFNVDSLRTTQTNSWIRPPFMSWLLPSMHFWIHRSLIIQSNSAIKCEISEISSIIQ
jgi:hypothetical protein